MAWESGLGRSEVKEHMKRWMLLFILDFENLYICCKTDWWIRSKYLTAPNKILT